MGIISCNGVCLRYKAINGTPRHGRYRLGQKRCQICDLFVFWEGIRCPCCGFILRTKPRNSKFKNRVRSQNDYSI